LLSKIDLPISTVRPILASNSCEVLTRIDVAVAASVELVRALPAWGSLVISKGFLCFWRKSLVGADIKLKIPLVDIDDVTACKAFGFRIFGLAVQVRSLSSSHLPRR
jgi:hypothetical protein